MEGSKSEEKKIMSEKKEEEKSPSASSATTTTPRIEGRKETEKREEETGENKKETGGERTEGDTKDMNDEKKKKNSSTETKSECEEGEKRKGGNEEKKDEKAVDEKKREGEAENDIKIETIEEQANDYSGEKKDKKKKKKKSKNSKGGATEKGSKEEEEENDDDDKREESEERENIVEEASRAKQEEETEEEKTENKQKGEEEEKGEEEKKENNTAVETGETDVKELLNGEGEHELERSWMFWHYDTGVTIQIPPQDQAARLSVATKDYVSHLHALNAFHTVEGFFRYWRCFAKPSELPREFLCHLFKNPCRPLWEDFPNGGCWNVRYRKHALPLRSMDVIWESLVLSSIGEMFDCSDVVGVVLNKKMKEVVFSVWIEANEDGHVDPLVSQRIKEKLSELCPPFASPYFQYRSFEVFLKETRGGHNKTRGSSRSPGGAPKRDGGGDRKETDASPHLHPHHSYYCASPSASPSFKPSSYKVNGSVGDYYQPPHPNSSSSKRNAQQGSSLLPSPVLSAKGEFPRPFHAAPPLLPTPRGGGGGSASATSTTTTTAGGSSAVSSSSSSSS